MICITFMIYLSLIFISIICLWGVRNKDWGLSFQEGVSYTYTLRLGYSRDSILYKNK